MKYYTVKDVAELLDIDIDKALFYYHCGDLQADCPHYVISGRVEDWIVYEEAFGKFLYKIDLCQVPDFYELQKHLETLPDSVTKQLNAIKVPYYEEKLEIRRNEVSWLEKQIEKFTEKEES